MNRKGKIGKTFIPVVLLLICIICFPLATLSRSSDSQQSEALYRELSNIANGRGDPAAFAEINRQARDSDWSGAERAEFVGNLRILQMGAAGTEASRQKLYILRKLSGQIFILATPADPAALNEGAASYYAGLDGMYENKMNFGVEVIRGTVLDQPVSFARLTGKPTQVTLDRIFKICIILMLFFVMVGMGLTLTLKDFSVVFAKPRGVIVGQLLQFGFMPLMAMAAGHLLGFYEEYPFIFVGMVLITAIPGGVTSNLMTYYAKGDLALSISLTCLSTVLSLVFTPLLLAFYCTGIPDVSIPVDTVIKTIVVLVIIPLGVGMCVRRIWPEFANRSTPFFSALGIVALLVLIIAGVLSNLHAFADTERYGLKFYASIFMLTVLGMVAGVVFSKLVGITNFQARAISLETGLRNSVLAMTMALLIQDRMGDFYSSMFVTSGAFGLIMYLAGLLAIISYKKLLPVTGEPPSKVDESAAA
ncbi:bile acid:sodium symporter family protein [Thermodesulfobacteriota bacterium]